MDINLAPIKPPKLPLELNRIILDVDIIRLISKANQEIGTYRGFLTNLQNPFLLLAPLIGQEAVLSSKLEGTHATLEDLLNFEAGNEVFVEKDDITEISNYRKALYFCLEEIGTISSDGKLPLCSKAIRKAHKILLSSGRGSSKHPGEFKQMQNYIGGSNGIDLVPVSPEDTQDYIANLEQYFHYDEADLLVQAAIIHAQFEMIHPFEDGNGRIGRLLIPLFLYYKEFLSAPTFYMSHYFESNRHNYLDALSAVSQNNDWGAWIRYFLEGVIQESSRNTGKAKSILNLYEAYKELIYQKTSSKFAYKTLDFIFETPLFSSGQLINYLSAAPQTIYNQINNFKEWGILNNTNSDRNRTYYCPSLLSIIQN